MYSDHTFYAVEGVLLVLLVVTFLLVGLIRGLQRQRPDFHIGRTAVTAVLIRIAAAGAISLTSIARQLRGGDELTFLGQAHAISHIPLLAPASLSAMGSQLQVWLFAQQLRIFSASDLALRCNQIGLAVAGLALVAAAVYDLAGPRAAATAGWILAIEPSNLFFSSLLHKEAPQLFAEGLVAFGGAQVWRGRRSAGLLWMGLGCLVATATRPYIGWFLTAASAAIALHATLRRDPRSPAARRPTALAAAVVLFAAVAIPVVVHAAPRQLERLQLSQQANTSDNSNLKFEQVDYSTPAKIVTNLPQRMFDFLFKPYPWQLANIRQRLGLLGTTMLLICLWILGRAALQARRRLIQRAGPLIYIGFFLLVAFSITAGNAGTAFRYRTHVVAMGVCIIAAVRATTAERRGEPSTSRVRAGPELKRTRESAGIGSGMQVLG